MDRARNTAPLRFRLVFQLCESKTLYDGSTSFSYAYIGCCNLLTTARAWEGEVCPALYSSVFTIVSF